MVHEQHGSQRPDSRSDAHVCDTDRDTVARRLAMAAADRRITREELERRLAMVQEAVTYGDLELLVRDLPKGDEPFEYTIPEQTIPETLHLSAPLRDARRRGRWVVPRRILASAGRGSVYLDFTEASVEHDEVTVDARPNWGSIELVVPEGYSVTAEESVPGSSKVTDQTTAVARSGAPTIHVVAEPGLGSIVVRHPHPRRRGRLPRMPGRR